MKGGGQARHGLAVGLPLQQIAERGRRVVDPQTAHAHDAVFQRHRVIPACKGCGGLQGYGCLALVTGGVDESEKARGGVEQPPGAGGARAVDLALHHGPYHLGVAPVEPPEESVGGLLKRGRAERFRPEDMPEGHPAGMPHRGLAAGQRRGGEAPHAPTAGQVGDEHLPAPQRAVVPETESVVGDADERPAHPVLGGARGHVGVMVLHRDAGHGLLQGPAGGQISGVQVVCDGARDDPGESAQVRICLPERLVRGRVRQISVVRADVGHARVGEGEGVLRLRARARERYGCGRMERQGRGGQAAGAAHGERKPACDGDHGVVVAGADRPVVGEEAVGHAFQGAMGISVVDGDGLVGEVAAGDHERSAELVQQQVMQASGGQEQAEPVGGGGQ
ncbi:hypothetical protein SMD44_08116 [Streptomyces alboflavus]|uniref:Uncharacterized protein n=1 Tax=Streptomyces alboflavus TaxID=67267 RepID=A0A1Z1WQG5_9ACTN|nr:hypothetical protein SMD44_08116 [Streptomyces alboflavus]